MPYPVRPRAPEWSGRQDLNLRILPLPKRALYQAELRPVSYTPPSELMRRLAAVTVRAANDTFGDLGDDPVSSPSPPYHVSYVVDFSPTHMVKFQNDRIHFATIDAALATQIFGQPSLIR